MSHADALLIARVILGSALLIFSGIMISGAMKL